MTSKTSLLNSGIFKYNMKRFWWVSAIYAFLQFLAVPYRILCDKDYLSDRAVRFPERIHSVLTEDGTMFVLLIGAAIVLGVCVFRYLQRTRSATLFHAFPVNRTQLYVTTLVSGFVLLMAPILLNGIILCLMSLLGGFNEILPLYVIGDWIVGQLITGTSTLCFTIFVGVFTGSSIAQIIFVFILSFLPIGVLAVVSELLNGWLFGFTTAGMTPVYETVLQTIPMYYPQFFSAEYIWWIPVLNGVYILLFSGLGLFFYYKRDVERAGDVVAFSWVKPIFLYGVTFCAMLFGSAFFTEISGGHYIDGSAVTSVFFFLIFALIGYASAKILLVKSFRILKYYKGYVVFAVLILLTFFAIDSNIFGFGTRVPEASNVIRAYVGEYYFGTLDYENTNADTGGAVLTDNQEIAMVLALHEDMIEAGNPETKEEWEGKRPIYVAYELGSGRKMVRYYWGEEEKLFEIFNTKGAKDYMFPNFRVHPERIQYITVLPYQNREEATVYGDQKEELIACVQKDLERLKYEQISDRYSIAYETTVHVSGAMSYAIPTEEPEQFNYYSMEVGTTKADGSHHTVWFTFNDNFTETLTWLSANGFTRNEIATR